MRSRMRLQNAVGTAMDLEVFRTITIQDACPYTAGLGGRADFVGFESRSWVTNMGARPLARETGTVAAWTPSIQRNGPRAVVIFPFWLLPVILPLFFIGLALLLNS